MQRITGFWKFSHQGVYRFLILLLILLLANASFQDKGMTDASLLEKGKACEKMISGDVNDTDFNYPMYLATRVNISLIGIIPSAYMEWISCLIKENAWSAPRRLFNLPLPCLPKRSLALLGHRLVNFSMDSLESMKIRE